MVKLYLALHLCGAREENIILKMNMLVQILLKTLQSLIECLIADTAVRRNAVALAQLANLF